MPNQSPSLTRLLVLLGLAASGSAYAAGSRTPKVAEPSAPPPPATAVTHAKEERAMSDSETPPAIPHEYLVKFKTEEGAARRAELFKRHQVKERNKVGSDRLYLIEVPANLDEKAVANAIGAEADVKYIEANMVMRIMPMKSGKKSAPK